MAQETIGIKIQVEGGDAVKSVGSLKQQLREAQNEVNELSEKFGATSKEAVQAARRAAELKDAIGDAKALTDAFNPDAKFKAFTSTLSAVAGGFGAVQGALGLIGVESEAVEETLLKVQSAMAISQGLQAIGEGIDSFKQLGAVIQNSTLFQKANNAATIIAAQVQRAFGVAVTGTGTAFKALRAAIMTTGIGALVVGIGMLVTAIMDWTSSSEDAEEAQARLNSEIEKQNDLLKTQLGELDYVTRAQIARAKLANKSEAEITKIAADGQQKRLEILKKDFEDAIKRESSADFAKLGLEEQDKIRKENTEKQRSYANERDKIELEGLEKQAKNLEEANKKASEIAKSNAQKNAENEIQYQNQIEQLRVSRLQRSTDFANKLRDADIEKKKLQQEKELENEKNLLETRDNLVQESIDRNLDNIKKLQEGSKERSDVLRELLFSQTEIEIANLDNEFQRKFNIIKGNKEAELALEEQYEGLKKNLRMNALNQELGNYASAAGNIAQILGQTTAAGKAFAIAEATINTYKAASQVFAAPVPGVAPVSLGVKIATMISALATGFKNVKSIIGTKTNGTVGSPNISTSNVAAPIAPTPTPQVQSTLLNAQAIQQLANATSRAYVVESDVSSSQERIRRINRAARLG